MAELPVIGLRAPANILSQIDGRIGSEGKNRSEVILALVQKRLGMAASPDTKLILKRLDKLERRVK